ncbi:MAG TPA: hypothetical protein VFW62_13620 [bacterium]|nr:hypothetical protein [bacterium]
MAWMDLSNGQVLDHFGGYGRAEGGIEYHFNDTFFAQAGVAGSFGGLSRGLGSGITSSLHYQSILGHGRLGAQFFGGNLRFTGGIELGATHVGASECADGMSCGALFTRNAQLLPIDSWTFSFGADLGISTLQGALGIFLRYNNLPGVNPSFNVLDGEPLSFGLNISALQVGVGVDLVSVYNLITGNSRPAASRPAESVERPRSSEPAETSSETETAEVAPQGLALVRQRHERAAELRRLVASWSAQVASARGLYQGIRGRSADDMRNLRLYASEAATQSLGVSEHYQELVQVITQAQTAAAALSGEERATADGLVSEMATWQTEARRQASTAIRQAQEVVDHFNALPDHGDGITMSAEDPIPGGRRRARRERTRAESPTRTDPPTRSDPPARTDPPTRTDSPVPADPPTRTDPPSSRDAGPPPLVFDPSMIDPSPTRRPDAGPPPARRPDTDPPPGGGSSIDENG